jgi:hypothetical protein
MIVMVLDRPRWVCDVCRYDMPDAGEEVLYSRASSVISHLPPTVRLGN